jgi:hypothetical protein
MSAASQFPHMIYRSLWPISRLLFVSLLTILDTIQVVLSVNTRLDNDYSKLFMTHVAPNRECIGPGMAVHAKIED